MVIAGITSYLGAGLAVHYLRRGHHVVALYHGPSKDVHYALNLVDPSKRWHQGQLDVIYIDQKMENLGLDHRTRSLMLPKIKELYHCASYLDTAAKRQGDVSTDLRVTERLVGLFREMQGERFIYISSFGVAGNATGLIEESLVPHDRNLHNIYERAKAANENLLMKLIPQQTIIFRPSAIVEAVSEDWKAGIPVSWTAIYNYVKCIVSLKTMLGIDTFSPLNLEGREIFISGRKLNMLPVDQAVDAILACVGNKTALGRIINLLNPHDVDYYDFLKDLFAYFHIRNVHIRLGPNPKKPPKRDDDQILFYLSRIVSVLNPYVRDDRVFQLDHLNLFYEIERLHRYKNTDIQAMIERSLALDFGESIPDSIRELRRYARYSTSLMIGIKKLRADDYEVGTGCDVSLSGLRLKTSESFHLDEELRISFDPDPEIGDIHALAKVVWQKDQPDGMSLLGLEFSHLDSQMKLRLESYINNLNRQRQAS